jgi:nicotinamidase-related amidase
MRVIKDRSIGLIIDIQEKLFPHIADSEQLIKNTQILIEGLKLFKIPILLTEQYTKGLGFTVEPIKLAIGEQNSIEKRAFSCCDEPNFDLQLSFKNKHFVIIAGIETHVCVLQTVVDLIASGFQPIVIEDCVSSRKLNDKKVAIERMRQEGAYISTYESILFELARSSESAEFKAISKLVK